jgi:transcriptional regulator with XRE-family HTH domain
MLHVVQAAAHAVQEGGKVEIIGQDGGRAAERYFEDIDAPFWGAIYGPTTELVAEDAGRPFLSDSESLSRPKSAFLTCISNIAIGYIQGKNFQMPFYIEGMKNTASTLGMNIKDLRKQKGWTQVDLAQRLGCSQAMITAYERGLKRPATDKLTSIAHALGVTIDQLFNNTAKQGRAKPKNLRLWKRFEKVEALPPRDKQMIFRMIEGLAAQNHG